MRPFPSVVFHSSSTRYHDGYLTYSTLRCSQASSLGIEDSRFDLTILYDEKEEVICSE